MRYQRAELPLQLDGLTAAREFFADCLADGDPTRESLWVAHVDDQARSVHLSRHAGDKTGAAFPLREIMADAAEHGSAGIVLAHNHPTAIRARAIPTAARLAGWRPPPRPSTAPSSII
jgi:DNA repair protein RadC